MTNDCCKKQENRTVAERREGGIVVEVCKVCGCKHHRMKADPVVIDAKALFTPRPK